MAGFPTTRWSLVVGARAQSDDARSALNDLCRAYRSPVLGFIQRCGYAFAQAEDLTQAFFAEFIQNAYFARADPDRGRFRNFLLVQVKRFVANAEAHRRTLKRGGDAESVQLDAVELVDAAENPEAAFERQWALTVFERAHRRLCEEARAAGKLGLVEQLEEFLFESPHADEYARAASTLGLRRNTLAVTVHRLRQRLAALVREEVAQTLIADDDLDDELARLGRRLAQAGPRRL